MSEETLAMKLLIKIVWFLHVDFLLLVFLWGVSQKNTWVWAGAFGALVSTVFALGYGP